jgi:hypothetical protein
MSMFIYSIIPVKIQLYLNVKRTHKLKRKVLTDSDRNSKHLNMEYDKFTHLQYRNSAHVLYGTFFKANRIRKYPRLAYLKIMVLKYRIAYR